jgi:hypothetical protein
MAIKNVMVGMKMAKQPSKGAPKDGCFRDISPVKNNPQNPYTNPSKAVAKGMEHKVGKLGR